MDRRVVVVIAWTCMLMLAGCTTDSQQPATVPVPTEGPTAAPTPGAAPTTAAAPSPEPEPTSSAPRPSPSSPEPTPLQGPEPGPAPEPVIVAVIDSGIRADHAAFQEGQVVAWYDFGQGGESSVPPVLWDPETGPYDDDGHGTAVASMVGGISSGHTPSHAPGVRLAVAKTATGDEGHYWQDVANAITWATDVVGADVVTMSVYSYNIVIAPSGLDGGLDAIAYARSKGVLPVMLAGNGNQNMGIPTLSWMHPPASSPHALVVGGADEDGAPVAPLGSMDPEVTALYYVDVACNGGPTCYDSWSGTSFSTPLVAGMAAHLIGAARAAGMEDPDPDRLEELLKNAARDGALYPPMLEGYGFLDAEALAVAEEHLLAGTTPERDAVGQASAAYVENVQQTEREAWTTL